MYRPGDEAEDETAKHPESLPLVLLRVVSLAEVAGTVLSRGLTSLSLLAACRRGQLAQRRSGDADTLLWIRVSFHF